MAEDTIILPSQPKKYHFRAHVFLYQTVDYFHVHLKGNEEIWIQIELHFGQSSHVLHRTTLAHVQTILGML